MSEIQNPEHPSKTLFPNILMALILTAISILIQFNKNGMMENLLFGFFTVFFILSIITFIGFIQYLMLIKGLNFPIFLVVLLLHQHIDALLIVCIFISALPALQLLLSSNRENTTPR